MKKNIYKFIGVGFEICGVVFICFFIGLKIDKKQNTQHYAILLSFLGILYALFALFKKVKKG